MTTAPLGATWHLARIDLRRVRGAAIGWVALCAAIPVLTHQLAAVAPLDPHRIDRPGLAALETVATATALLQALLTWLLTAVIVESRPAGRIPVRWTASDVHLPERPHGLPKP